MMNYREAAVRYLGTGEKSTKQIETFLSKREATEEEIKDIVAFLKELGYLNDIRYSRGVFAREYAKGRGKARTFQYLKAKGVSVEDAESGYEAFLKECDREIDERKMALNEGIKVLADKELDEKMKAKIARRLAGRGFASKDIYYVLDVLKSGKI